MGIAASAIIYPGVVLGDNCQIEEFVLVGVLSQCSVLSQHETRIGSNALIRSHTVIYEGNLIGVCFQTGHGVMIRELNEIGDNVSIGTHSIIEHHVKIGKEVRIHSNAFVPEYSILEDRVWIGPNAVLTNAKYPLSPQAKDNLKGPHLLSGAKIGASATLMPAVVIGRNALIGAGSVVVEDVPDDKVVVGNPGRVIKDIADLSAYQVDRLLK